MRLGRVAGGSAAAGCFLDFVGAAFFNDKSSCEEPLDLGACNVDVLDLNSASDNTVRCRWLACVGGELRSRLVILICPAGESTALVAGDCPLAEDFDGARDGGDRVLFVVCPPPFLNKECDVMLLTLSRGSRRRVAAIEGSLRTCGAIAAGCGVFSVFRPCVATLRISAAATTA